MINHYTESHYENAVLQLFQERLGYNYIYVPDVDRDYHSPLYAAALLPALRRVNRCMPEEAITEAVYKLKNFESGSLLQKNKVLISIRDGIHPKLVSGRSI